MKKQTKPLVSVIMPVYNAELYLVDAIESILNQTVENFEFLMIDDCSTDDSWHIMRAYQKRYKCIRLYRNTRRKGLALSLNILLPKTRGNFIARMDADDIALPNRFLHQLRYLKKHPRVVACGGHEYVIDGDGEVIGEKRFPTDSQACREWIMNYMVIQPPLLMARGTIMRALTYDNSIFGNDDISMHFKLLKRGDFGNVDKIIFKYRKRGDSLTHINPKKVYFLALRVRLKAILDGIYVPGIFHTLIAIIETIIVGVLPNIAIVALFDLVRMHKNFFAIPSWKPILTTKRFLLSFT